MRIFRKDIRVDKLMVTMPVDYCNRSLLQSCRSVNQDIDPPSTQSPLFWKDLPARASGHLPVRFGQRYEPNICQHLPMRSDILPMGHVHSWALLQHRFDPHLRERFERRFGFLHPVPAIGPAVEAASIENEEDATRRDFSYWYLVSVVSSSVRF